MIVTNLIGRRVAVQFTRKSGEIECQIVLVGVDDEIDVYIIVADLTTGEMTRLSYRDVRIVWDRDKREPKYESLEDWEVDCVMTVEAFESGVRQGGFTGDDGHGVYMPGPGRKSKHRVSFSGNHPKWATHVCWYNK